MAGRCALGGHVWQGARVAGGHVWQRACVVGGVHGRGHAWHGGVHGRGAYMARGQERRPLQRAVRILLECILVIGVCVGVGVR